MGDRLFGSWASQFNPDPEVGTGPAETGAMGVGLRPTGKPADKPLNLKAARAAILPDRRFSKRHIACG